MTYERQTPETIIALQAARIETLEKQLREALELAKGISGGNEAAAGGSGSRLVGEDEQPPRSSMPTTLGCKVEHFPAPEQIERAYIDRGHKPLRKLAIVRKPSSAQCFAAADALPPDGPEAA